jgi:hypothetical protein
MSKRFVSILGMFGLLILIIFQELPKELEMVVVNKPVIVKNFDKWFVGLYVFVAFSFGIDFAEAQKDKNNIQG